MMSFNIIAAASPACVWCDSSSAFDADRIEDWSALVSVPFSSNFLNKWTITLIAAIETACPCRAIASDIDSLPGLVGTFQDSDGRGRRHRLLLPLWLERGGGLNFPLATSRSVGQPLTDYAAQCTIRALYVVDSESHPIVVPEIELGEVTVQMCLGNV